MPPKAGNPGESAPAKAPAALLLLRLQHLHESSQAGSCGRCRGGPAKPTASLRRLLRLQHLHEAGQAGGRLGAQALLLPGALRGRRWGAPPPPPIMAASMAGLRPPRRRRRRPWTWPASWAP